MKSTVPTCTWRLQPLQRAATDYSAGDYTRQLEARSPTVGSTTTPASIDQLDPGPECSTTQPAPPPPLQNPTASLHILSSASSNLSSFLFPQNIELWEGASASKRAPLWCPEPLFTVTLVSLRVSGDLPDRNFLVKMNYLLPRANLPTDTHCLI